MYKMYGFGTQKGKVIRSMIIRGADKWFEDFELEKTGKIFIGNNVGPRLSELLKEGIVEVKYFENPNKWKWLGYNRARYKLKEEAIYYYTKIYNIGILDKFLF